MGTYALVSAFPPASGSLNEYGYHLARAIAARPDVDRLVVIADVEDQLGPEWSLSSAIEVRRVWRFNDPAACRSILRALRDIKPDGVLFNVQMASFGDREVPAAIGLLTPMLSRLAGHPTGVIAHNLFDAVNLESTHLAGKPVRQWCVRKVGGLMTRALLRAHHVSVTLDSFADILRERYGARNAFMVPHGSFGRQNALPVPLKDRPKTFVTMGKFGTYKRLERMISAFQRLCAARPGDDLKLVIGGSDHPAKPGYIESVRAGVRGDERIVFRGYVPEQLVESFFGSARLAIFDYDSTTGSSGVLHQAAIYGTPAAYPLIGDFLDVTHREGLSGYHFEAFSETGLLDVMTRAIEAPIDAQQIAHDNLAAARGLPMATIAAIQVSLLKQAATGRFHRIRHDSGNRNPDVITT